MSRRPRVAVLPGDGVGPEVVPAAVECARAAGLEAEFVEGRIGWELWRTEGEPLPEETWRLLEGSDACLFGAITSKPPQDAMAELSEDLRGKGVKYRSPLLRMRQGFDLAVNFRPCRHIPGTHSGAPGTDIAIFRENTEGLYCQVEYPAIDGDVRRALSGHPAFSRFSDVPASDMSLSCRVITRKASRRICDAAFAYAAARGLPEVVAVEKANVLRATGGMFLEEARESARAHPGIVLTEQYVDSAAMGMVRDPARYRVVVATNMFGDILSDIGGALAGSIGVLPSGSYGPRLALFEPVHGSAPDIAKTGRANPIGAILSGALMAEHLGLADGAAAIRRAVDETVLAGEGLTPDMGGRGTTLDTTRKILERIEAR